MTVSSRQELREWCLMQLGAPVLDINIDERQIEMALDMAFQFFQDFHFDGTEKTYLKYQLTDQDIINKYVPLSNNVIGVNRIFPIADSNASVNMFDLRYQLRLHELYDFTSTSYVGYTLTMQHIRTLELLFSGEQPIRFNRNTNKLFIDWNWGTTLLAGQWLIIEAYVIIDPSDYPRVYDDRMLKKLATAYMRKLYAENLRKYSDMPLPGGMKINGQQMYADAVQEVKDVEVEVRSSYEPPMVAFVTG